IEEHDVEAIAGPTAPGLERTRNARADNNIAVHDPAARQVLFDERLRAAIALNEGRLARAAAEGLDAERAGACVCVQDARSGHTRREDIEDRLAQLVRGRTQSAPRWRIEAPAFVRARDHAHLFLPSLPALPAPPALLSNFYQLETVFPRFEELANRGRRRRRRLEPCRCLALRDVEPFAIADEIDRAEGGHARLARAEEIAGSPQPQIALGDLEPVGRIRHRFQPLA